MSYNIVQIKKTPSVIEAFCTDETEVDNITEWMDKRSNGIYSSAVVKTTKYRVSIHHTGRGTLDELIVALLNMGWEPINFSDDETLYNFRRARLV